MAQLVIYTSPREERMTKSEFGQFERNLDPHTKKLRKQNNKGPLTPRLKERGSKRVINLPFYDPKTDYSSLAQDLCLDAGDKFYGHEIN